MRTLPVELIQSVKQTVSGENDEREEHKREGKITMCSISQKQDNWSERNSSPQNTKKIIKKNL